MPDVITRTSPGIPSSTGTSKLSIASSVNRSPVAPIAGRRTGRVTRRITVRRPTPLTIADSSREGSTARKAPASTSIAIGASRSDSTKTIPGRPKTSSASGPTIGSRRPLRIPARGEARKIQANVMRMPGTRSGVSETRSRTRRNGRSVRTNRNASVPPITSPSAAEPSAKIVVAPMMCPKPTTPKTSRRCSSVKSPPVVKPRQPR